MALPGLACGSRWAEWLQVGFVGFLRVPASVGTMAHAVVLREHRVQWSKVVLFPLLVLF